MAKTKRKRQAEVREKNQEKKFFQITALVTIILLIVLYFIFRS